MANAATQLIEWRHEQRTCAARAAGVVAFYGRAAQHLKYKEHDETPESYVEAYERETIPGTQDGRFQIEDGKRCHLRPRLGIDLSGYGPNPKPESLRLLR